ncbi:MAG: XrtN system VIT domain-containing protein [Bacteroidota bacterium]
MLKLPTKAQINRLFPPLFNDFHYSACLVFYLGSLACFVFSDGQSGGRNDLFTDIFFFNYFFTILGFCFVLSYNKTRLGGLFRFKSINHNIVLLLLANISAFSLNRSLPIFDQSVPWVVGLLVALNIALLWHSFGGSCVPRPFSLLMVIILSIGWLFSVYQVIYIYQAHLVGILYGWFFGIALHIFVPLLFTILIGRLLWYYQKRAVAYRYAILAGFLIPLGMLIFFCQKWAHIDRLIEKAYVQQANNPFERDDLPYWVKLGQELPKDWITLRILKSGIVYRDDFQLGVDRRLRTSFNRQIQHDPLVLIATNIKGKFWLNDQDQLRLLNTIFNTRHETERRLWSGGNLETGKVTTSVQLFPEYQMAYTEKELTIQNHHTYTDRKQEAIYRFYLPEGAAVTSASLWIDGIEQSSFLTTKEKAEEAYNTIVGREKRDPLLIHWQEGNQLSLRVFPCTRRTPRRFKIGITSPLKVRNGRQYYENIDFKGPFWKGAKEQIYIGGKEDLDQMTCTLPLEEGYNCYSYQGRYRSSWQLSLPAKTISTRPFTFNDQQYTLSAPQASAAHFSAQQVYLDIHQGWSRRRFNQVWEAVKGKEVYVYTGAMIRLTEGNRQSLFRRLRKQNFSLFPIHKIKNPAQALLITAYSQLTPTLKDLEDSPFSNELLQYIAEAPPALRCYNLDKDWSPFLATLKQFRLLHSDGGTVKKLAILLRLRRFRAQEEDQHTVVLPGSGLKIRQTEAVGPGGTAPDHLLRLFAYNRLLKEAAPYYFSGAADGGPLIQLAALGHVLSPVSSLVVLEKAEDYGRFDIQKNQNGLGNASIKSAGSVPEPHEWLLILLSLGTAIWLLRRELLARLELIFWSR